MLGKEEHGVARSDEDGRAGIELAAVMLFREQREDHERGQLRHAADSRQHGVHVDIAVEVLHVIGGKARRGAVADHEQGHGERGPHELVVFRQRVPHVADGELLLVLLDLAVLLHAEQREAQTGEVDDAHGHGDRHPRLRRVAEGSGDGLPADHDDVHADVRADAGEGAVILALLLVLREGGQERPVGDVVDAVADIPEDVGHGEEDDVGRAGADVAEEDQVEDHGHDAADEDRGFELAPLRVDVVDDEAGDGVVQRVGNTQDGEHKTDRREHMQRQREDVGQEIQKRVCLKRIEHVAADGAEAEEVFVAAVKVFHDCTPPE